MRAKFELRLQILGVGAEGIEGTFGRRRRKESGAYLIIARACGFAFDTAFASGPGNRVILWPPHGLRHQLWHLRPTGVAGEVAIVAVANGLALDATRETSGDPYPVMHGRSKIVLKGWITNRGWVLRSDHERRAGRGNVTKPR